MQLWLFSGKGGQSQVYPEGPADVHEVGQKSQVHAVRQTNFRRGLEIRKDSLSRVWQAGYGTII